MFWGLTIEPGKRYTQTVEESFHVSMVALDTRDVATTDREQAKLTQLMVQHERAEFLVCTLCYGTVFQQPLDLNFTEGEEVTFFSEGRGTLHLTGYLVKDEPMSLDPDMMALEEMSSSDEMASDSGDEDEVENAEEEEDGPSLQELAFAPLEDDEDDDDEDEWKPKEGKMKRKKNQKKKTDSKRQHVDEPDPEPRKAKQLATLEISKSGADSFSSDESNDVDYSPMDAALVHGDQDIESDDEDELLEWEEEEDKDGEDEEDSDSSEDENKLYDERDSDYDGESGDDDDDDVEVISDEEEREVTSPSLRSKQDSRDQLKKTMSDKLKSTRILRSTEAHSPKKRQRDQSTPLIEKPVGSKTPDGKTPGDKIAGEKRGKTPTGKTLATERAANGKTPGSETGGRRSNRSKTPENKISKAKLLQGKATTKTPTMGTGAQGNQGQKTPKQRTGVNQTPKSLKGKGKDQQATTTPKKTKLQGGTVIEDLVAGDGKVAKAGKMVHVYYRGTLASNSKEFDSCMDGKPFMFRLGSSEVIKGWDMGIAGMKVGGKRRLTVPASEGYGRQKVGPIPPNSALVFTVTLKNVS
ncbi:39 kDa FK506-binding nuclear protein-like isoform X4 [Acanthaster planci]|uniref:peptidylprolyl isomerase n=1 Tax=Acanthaster planci TaxID=133434 RepID=A0A8B7ZTJ8_ACAPL|nr:39 kDa FK506-binding nuclear protein-like isoform X4 [Acanthaster planci]